MGKDEHKTSKGKKKLAQTPNQQLSDSVDTEFSSELTVGKDKEAEARQKQANQRAKYRNKRPQ